MDKYVVRDVTEFVSTFTLGNLLKDSSILITGASGLIGSTLIFCLLALNKNIRIIAPVRNIQRTKTKLGDCADKIELIECDLMTFDYESIGKVDYIVHCAAPTGSKYFVDYAVETFEIIVDGTRRILNYAKNNCERSFVYLSSLEVYGSINDDTIPITEIVQGYLNPLEKRSSYPMAKRAAECLCHLYAKQYNLNVMIARLTQTTGAGISKDDNRVIAQFARLASQKKDIILHTSGESARPYCYTTDAICAILYILLKGRAGEAYNVSNDETYISARGIAEYLKDNFSPSINIVFDLNDDMGYAPPTKQRLNSSRLQSLGWRPRKGLFDILERLIDYCKD